MCKKNLRRKKKNQTPATVWNGFSHSPITNTSAPEAVVVPRYPISKGHLFVTWGGKKGSRKCLSFMAFKIFIHSSTLIETRCLQLRAQMVQNKHDSLLAETNYEQTQNLLSFSNFSLPRRKHVQRKNAIACAFLSRLFLFVITTRLCKRNVASIKVSTKKNPKKQLQPFAI